MDANVGKADEIVQLTQYEVVLRTESEKEDPRAWHE